MDFQGLAFKVQGYLEYLSVDPEFRTSKRPLKRKYSQHVNVKPCPLALHLKNPGTPPKLCPLLLC